MAADLSELSVEELQAELNRRGASTRAGHVRADTISNITVNGHLIPAGAKGILLPRPLAEEMLARGHVAKPARRRAAPPPPVEEEEEGADE